MNNKIKILCFLDYDNGRDVEIVLPVIYFAEKYLNATVEFAFIYDVHAIYRKKPQVVLLANTIGSWLHHLIAKYAHVNNIPVFALISEGNFPDNRKLNFYGYNTDRKFYQEYLCLWSDRAHKIMAKELPDEAHKMVLTGASGFDRYKMYQFPDKQDILNKYNLQEYKKVIGYAGWAFGKLFNPTGLMEIKSAHKENAEKRIQWMKEQMLLVESILRKAIESNPDTLFILKRHPNEIHPHLTQKDQNEMVNLQSYKNVLYLRNEEDVHSLISISDIWLAFESTTVIETWLMKAIPTIFINPDPDFVRDKNYIGTIIASSYQELQNYINEYFANGTIADFITEEKTRNREKIIADIIGFGDGLNHLRAGYYLKNIVDKIKKEDSVKVKFSLRYFRMYLLLHIGKLFYSRRLFLKLPKFKKTVWIFEKYKLKNLRNLQQKYYKFIDQFYITNKLPERIESGSIWKEIIK